MKPHALLVFALAGCTLGGQVERGGTSYVAIRSKEVGIHIRLNEDLGQFHLDAHLGENYTEVNIPGVVPTPFIIP